MDGAVLVTGEVDRTMPYEIGMPPAHQALHDGGWVPDSATEAETSRSSRVIRRVGVTWAG
jgi:hypothetical protein